MLSSLQINLKTEICFCLWGKFGKLFFQKILKIENVRISYQNVWLFCEHTYNLKKIISVKTHVLKISYTKCFIKVKTFQKFQRRCSCPWNNYKVNLPSFLQLLFLSSSKTEKIYKQHTNDIFNIYTLVTIIYLQIS